MSRKLKIAVLFGGRSPEHGVSLQSAAAVLRHMDRERYEPVMVGISQSGDWFHYTGPVSTAGKAAPGRRCLPAGAVQPCWYWRSKPPGKFRWTPPSPSSMGGTGRMARSRA